MLGERDAADVEDDAATSGALAGVVWELERADLDAVRLVALVGGADVTVAASTLPAVAAEMLIDRRRYEEAKQVLDFACDRFPADVRLRQLAALRWSRLGEPARAIELLEPLHHDGDEETAGILGGAYKRQWLDDRSNARLLALAERRYRDAWEHSRRTSPYLGINAATLALVQGRPDDARDIAITVRGLLERRHADIVRVRQDPAARLDAWDEGTLGEAALVLGDVRAASAHYRAAVALAAAGQAEVMAAQAAFVLAHCGGGVRWADLIEGA
jgi:tetratricopeptide (TPR) repeat protein